MNPANAELLFGPFLVYHRLTFLCKYDLQHIGYLQLNYRSVGNSPFGEFSERVAEVILLIIVH